jgi:hypothetical protein
MGQCTIARAFSSSGCFFVKHHSIIIFSNYEIIDKKIYSVTACLPTYCQITGDVDTGETHRTRRVRIKVLNEMRIRG